MTDRREDILQGLVEAVPYLRFLGLRLDMADGGLTTVLPFRPFLIGNPMIPALHGGVTAAFLEATAVLGLAWAGLGEGEPPDALPKTIDLTVDYLRAGQPKDAFARARVTRSGRRYASVRVEAWQDAPDRLFAEASGHFLMPRR